MLDKEILKGGGNPMTSPDLFAETILNLHREAVLTSNLDDFPKRISKPMREVIPFDKLFVFFSGAHDSSPTLIGGDNASMHWDKIHPHITSKDIHSSILYRGQPGDIFLSQDMKRPGCEGDEHALGLISHFSGLKFSIHLVLSVSMGYRLHLTLFRRLKPFDRNEAEIMRLFSPALIMNSNALLASRLSDSGELLLSASENKAAFHYLLLDNNFRVVGLPKPTRKFLAEHFHDPIIHGLPAPLREWLDNVDMMDRGHDHEGLRSTIFESSTGNIDCTYHVFEDSSGPSRALIVLNLSRDANDFTPLGSLGLTPQEIRVLGILYNGKNNSQMGELLCIDKSTIRKHLCNIGRKLHASGRTEILAKAIEARDMIPGAQRPSGTTPGMSPRKLMPRDFPQPDNWRETVIELHRCLPLLMDFDEAPELLRSTLTKDLPFDWAAIYCLKVPNEIEKIVTSQGLRCDWAKLYPAIRKFIRWVPIARMAEPGQIFLSQNLTDPTNEQDLFVKTVMEASTGAFNYLQMPIAKTLDHQVVLGLYRNDPGRPYTPDEVAYMESLSPVILSWAHAIVLLQENTFRQMGCQILLASGHIQAVLFDQHLCDIMWTKDALGLLDVQAGSDWREMLVPRLREWIKQTQLMHDKRKGVDRRSSERLIIESCNLECCAYPLEGHILIIFKRHSFEEPFAILEKCGLTKREIQVLSYLRLGYTNRQIANAMNIREVTVKKHMGHIGCKLEAVGRTAIMRRAEQLKRSLSK